MGSSPITRKYYYFNKMLNKKQNIKELDTGFKLLKKNINNISHEYNNLIRFSIKKGKKEKIENIYRKALFKFAEQKKVKFWLTLNQAIDNITIVLNVKIKRIGSKNIYIPFLIKKNHSIFLAYSWIIKGAKNRKEKKFSNKILNEIIETAENKSAASKKKLEIYTLVKENTKYKKKEKRKKKNL